MDEIARYRMRVLAVVAISLFGALGARLWYLQVMISEQAVATAASNITRVIDVPAPRGRILDLKGRTLVGNRLTTMITINPRELEEADLGQCNFVIIDVNISLDQYNFVIIDVNISKDQ